MNPDPMERRYEQARQQLDQVLYWRNEYLQQLQALCSMSMQTRSSGGMVLDFDVRQAAQLLDRIALQNIQIARAVEAVNRYACMQGQRRLEWRSQPTGQRARATAAD
jgi:hypothetical protein